MVDIFATMPTSTHVTYPAGAVTGRSRIQATQPLPDGRWGVVTAETPFHPLDHSWPDQPADTGELTVGEQTLPVLDCLTGAAPTPTAEGPVTEADRSEITLGTDIPVRRGTDGWNWLVVHVVPEEVPVGAECELSVDTDHRAALSAAHTGCHLLAFALNHTLADHWRKEVRADTLGHPDFDSLAMQSSSIGTRHSTDVYRLGKSLRKKGFQSDQLAEQLHMVTERVNAELARWVDSDAAVHVDTPAPELTSRRTWRCELPDGTASVLCGGTHPHALSDLAALRTELTLSEDGTELTAVTTPTRS